MLLVWNADVWQRPSQYFKAIIVQLKQIKFKKIGLFVYKEYDSRLKITFTLKRSYTMVKLDLSQGCKDSSVYANQSMWYTILINWKIKAYDNLNRCRESFQQNSKPIYD